MLSRSRGKVDPIKDEAAPLVLTAYRDAVADGKPTPECYRAGVKAWRTVHSDHAIHYAAAQAVEVIQRATARLRVETPTRPR